MLCSNSNSIAATLRPVTTTCVAACIGLLPAAPSTGIGSHVRKPLALVVVGGITLAPVLILVVLPIQILMFSRRGDDAAAGDGEDVVGDAATIGDRV